MAQTNLMLTRREFANRINLQRRSVRNKRRYYPYSGNPIPKSRGIYDHKREAAVLRSWERQYKKRFGNPAPRKTCKYPVP